MFIDADYLYAIPTIEVRYDSKATTRTSEYMVSSTKTATVDFNTANLNKFAKRFRFSRFARAIDNVDNSILSTGISMKVQKRFTPDLNTQQTVSLKFKNELRTSSIDSTSFTYSGFQSFFDDDGLGNVNIYRYNEDKVKTNVVENAGTIDYDTGEVVVNNFAPTAYEGIEIKVTATPENLDIVPTQETIIVLDPEAASITATAES